MKANNIKSFSVYGLFGTDDIIIPFDKDIKILIGENGLGKTQVLNLFYYTLTRNFFRLGEFHFDKLIIEFRNCKPIEITKKSIDKLNKEMFEHPMAKELIHDIGYSQFEKLRNNFRLNKGNLKGYIRKLEDEYRYSSKVFRKVPPHRVFDVLEELEMMGKKTNSLLNSSEKDILSGITKTDIMYFPTYRRVEEDLHGLGYDDDELLNQENTLIQFGMDDVQRRFNIIEGNINNYIKEGFSKLTSELVNQVFKDDESPQDNISNTDFLKDINENDIEILLSRTGDQISDSKKNKIRAIILNKEPQNNDNSLNLLLKKLIEIYSSQKQLDNSVKEFRDICNKYLVNKKVFYDESAIKIYIKSDRNEKTIELSKLSSGEKQIISMFSKIYLSDSENRFIVLFDEPELSLSLTWQKQLLPDILNSKKCDFLLAVTHSPFIFDNELDTYAIGLSEYVKPSEVIE